MPDGARYTFRPSPRVMHTSTAPKCPTCSKSVYAAEQIMGPVGEAYHKSCLRCTNCKKTLDALNLFEHGRDPYCKMCHFKAFGTKGVGYGNAVVGEYENPGHIASSISTTYRKPTTEHSSITLLPSHHSPGNHSPHSGPSSPLSGSFSRLNLQDQKPLLGGTAGLRIDPRLRRDDDFDVPFNSSPSSRPQISSYNDRSTQVSSNQPSAVDQVQTPKSPGQTLTPTLEDRHDETDDFEPPLTSFPQFVIKSKGPALPSFHSPAERPIGTRTPSQPALASPSPSLLPKFNAREFFELPATDQNQDQTSAQVSRTMSMKVPGPKLGRALASKQIGSPAILSLGSLDGPQLCPRCSSTVYHAEQVLALGKKWHKRCLRCCKCSKALDAGTMCERDGTPYCSRCYDQAFGTEAQGFVL
ncbi:hypothetical protein CROQUDRAFT_68989, partial [Cronartium quercuum f. sp. fusiforme G11]